MHPTHIDLPAGTRGRVIELLQPRLCEAIDLYLRFKQAHWNVKGPTFIQLHEFFDEGASEMQEHADVLAERLVQLGGTADGTAPEVAKSSKLEPYPVTATRASHHLKAITASVAAFGKSVRKNIDDADKLGDAGTADIFTQISRAIDKRLWFVESHLRP